MLALLAALAMTVEAGPAHPVWGPETGNRDHVPNLVGLSPLTAFGTHLAAFLDAETTEATTPRLFGRALSSSGRPVNRAVRWSRPGADVFNAVAAVRFAGRTGLAVWHQGNPADPQLGDLVTRPFDAGSAEPRAPERRIDRASFLYDAEAYRGGYAAMYVRRVPGTRRQHVLRLLDARGRPDGEVRELSRSRNAFGGELVGHASHRRMLMVTTPFNVVDFEIFGPDGTSVRRRIGGIRDAYLLDAAQGSGGAWMTLWAHEREGAGYQVVSRRLDARARLRAPVRLGTAALFPRIAEVAYRGRRGLAVWSARGRCPAFEAMPLDSRGRPQRRRPASLDVRCGGRRTEAGHGEFVASARRFVLGFSTFARGAEHFIRATGVRVRG